MAFGAPAGGNLLLASGGADGTVRLWDPIAGVPLGKPLARHDGKVTSVAFGTVAGDLLLAFEMAPDGFVCVWEPVAGHSVGDLQDLAARPSLR